MNDQGNTTAKIMGGTMLLLGSAALYFLLFHNFGNDKNELGDLKTFEGKDEMINGQWYPVTVQAENLKDANSKLSVGQRKSYGVVQKIRGRFSEVK